MTKNVVAMQGRKGRNARHTHSSAGGAGPQGCYKGGSQVRAIAEDAPRPQRSATALKTGSESTGEESGHCIWWSTDVDGVLTPRPRARKWGEGTFTQNRPGCKTAQPKGASQRRQMGSEI